MQHHQRTRVEIAKSNNLSTLIISILKMTQPQLKLSLRKVACASLSSCRETLKTETWYSLHGIL